METKHAQPTRPEAGTSRLAANLSEYQRCASCGVVDRDQERRRLRYPCPVCRVPGAGGLLHFPPGALALAELMEEGLQRPLAAVLCFCSLGEVLLQHFLAGRMGRMGLPEAVRHRLLDDHSTVKARQDRLFLTLTGETWKAAVRRLEESEGPAPAAALVFWRKAADARDWFLHRGFEWAISAEMARECSEQFPGLLALFAALHNEYVYTRPPAADPDE